jgi:DNA-binding NarL/FixJ family response regulator
MTSLQVLLVASDAALRDTVRESLTEALGPAAFVEVSEADQALQELRTGHWDLVLLDLHLPRTNGLVTLRWLKQVRPDVPVVVVTRLPAEPYASAAVRAGASAFISASGFTSKERARERVGGTIRALMVERARMGVQG